MKVAFLFLSLGMAQIFVSQAHAQETLDSAAAAPSQECVMAVDSLRLAAKGLGKLELRDEDRAEASGGKVKLSDIHSSFAEIESRMYRRVLENCK